MGSSEDYLDSLLRSMGVPAEETSPSNKENIDFHIDSAPSLEIPDTENASEEDITELMNDLMSRIAPESLSSDPEAEPDRVFVDNSVSEPDPEPEPEPEPEPMTEPEPMPEPDPVSESDVLSKILKSSTDNAASEEKTSEEEPIEFDLDAELAELLKEENESEGLPDENDIEALLGKAREEGLADDPDRSEMSLDELIAADSGPVSDIGSMLSKSDNNEAVDPGIEALLSGGDDFKVPSFDEEEDSESGTSGASETDPRKLSKEEKKEAKRKAKEEKAKQKALAKEKKKKKNDPEATAEFLLNSGEMPVSEDSEATDDKASAEDAPAQGEAEAEAPAGEAPGNELDEADSLLAEIMGGSFGNEFEGLDQEGDEDKSGKSAAPDSVAMDPDEVDALLESESGKKKKKGLFAKLLDLLTDSEEEEEQSSEIKLSDENATVLEQLDAEGEEVNTKKKKKKKKGKKSEAENADAEGAGDEEGSGEEGGKKKKKKEKKQKPEPEETGPVKKLNKKKVISIFAFCITLLAAVLIISRLMGNYTVKKEARQAYSVGDYQTAYQDLFGQDLNESDEIIFKKSECILRIRLWQREYELLRDESDVKALDSLIQTVYKYPALYESAIKWACIDEVDPVYRELLAELEREYGLTEEEALDIAQIKNDVDYTRAVYDVVNGNRVSHQEPVAPVEEDVLVTPSANEDVLPGENDPGSDVIFVNP